MKGFTKFFNSSNNEIISSARQPLNLDESLTITIEMSPNGTPVHQEYLITRKKAHVSIGGDLVYYYWLKPFGEPENIKYFLH